MTDTGSMDLVALLHKAQASDDLDFLREGVRVLAHALMEEEVTQHVGAKRHARTAERTGQRNGYRERQWDTRVGSRTLSVPRVRDGGYFPSLLAPRRRAERALLAVVQEAGCPLGQDAWGLHPARGRSGTSPRHHGHQQKRGVAHLCRA